MAQDKAEKKRKRAAKNGGHPSKKVVIDAPSQVVKVSILQETGDWAPVIGKSPRTGSLRLTPSINSLPST